MRWVAFSVGAFWPVGRSGLDAFALSNGPARRTIATDTAEPKDDDPTLDSNETSTTPTFAPYGFPRPTFPADVLRRVRRAGVMARAFYPAEVRSMVDDGRFVLSWQSLRSLLLCCPRGRLFGVGPDGRVLAGLAVFADWSSGRRVVVDEAGSANVFLVAGRPCDEPCLGPLLSLRPDAVVYSIANAVESRVAGSRALSVVLPWHWKPANVGDSVELSEDVASALNDHRRFYRRG